MADLDERVMLAIQVGEDAVLVLEASEGGLRWRGRGRLGCRAVSSPETTSRVVPGSEDGLAPMTQPQAGRKQVVKASERRHEASTSAALASKCCCAPLAAASLARWLRLPMRSESAHCREKQIGRRVSTSVGRALILEYVGISDRGTIVIGQRHDPQRRRSVAPRAAAESFRRGS